MDTPPLRVVLIDDHEMVLQGLKAMLARFLGRVRVVGDAADAETAERVVAVLDPDIVLCDVRLRGSSGLDLCKRLVEREPGRRVVLLSVYDDEQYLYQALRAGAVGYLLKRVTGEELVRQLELVQAGETVVDSALAGRAARSAARLQSGEFWPGGAAMAGPDGSGSSDGPGGSALRDRTARVPRAARTAQLTWAARATGLVRSRPTGCAPWPNVPS
jgi:DNA-binding NarL/FixJ family response regulator